MPFNGPVNKRAHKETQKAQQILFVAFVALPEPTDDRVTFAARDWTYFVDRVCRESDKQSGFACQRKGAGLIVKVQRATTELITQKHNDRDTADAQMVEIDLLSVAVLMTNEKVARLIAQKLRALAISEALTKVCFQR